jgi:hypothetical protein
MDPKVSALERAFKLARSGQAVSIDDTKVAQAPAIEKAY